MARLAQKRTRFRVSLWLLVLGAAAAPRFAAALGVGHELWAEGSVGVRGDMDPLGGLSLGASLALSPQLLFGLDLAAGLEDRAGTPQSAAGGDLLIDWRFDASTWMPRLGAFAGFRVSPGRSPGLLYGASAELDWWRATPLSGMGLGAKFSWSFGDERIGNRWMFSLVLRSARTKISSYTRHLRPQNGSLASPSSGPQLKLQRDAGEISQLP